MLSGELRSGRRPLVLFFNSFFGTYPDVSGAGGCAFTTDPAHIRKADAVVFHLPGIKQAGRLPKYAGQIWVAWCLESEVTCRIMADANAMRHFEIKMTYRRDADVWTTYGPKRAEFEAIRLRPVPEKTEPAPLVMFQSARYDRSGRYAFAEELMRHVRTDSYGRQLNNRVVEGPDSGRATKLEAISRYKFCLAIENSIAADYVTEKFFDAFAAGTVPVYRGAPNIAEFAPGPRSFIDVAEFPGPAELASHLNRLAVDDAAYREYHAWRDRPPEPRLVRDMEAIEEDSFSRLGRVVREKLGSQGTERRPGSKPAYPLSWTNEIRRLWTPAGRG